MRGRISQNRVGLANMLQCYVHIYIYIYVNYVCVYIYTFLDTYICVYTLYERMPHTISILKSSTEFGGCRGCSCSDDEFTYESLLLD